MSSSSDLDAPHAVPGAVLCLVVAETRVAPSQIRVASIICSFCERMIVFDSMKVKALRSILVLCFCAAFLRPCGRSAGT
jgi:hypothetical protein